MKWMHLSFPVLVCVPPKANSATGTWGQAVVWKIILEAPCGSKMRQLFVTKLFTAADNWDLVPEEPSEKLYGTNYMRNWPTEAEGTADLTGNSHPSLVEGHFLGVNYPEPPACLCVAIVQLDGQINPSDGEQKALTWWTICRWPLL